MNGPLNIVQGCHGRQGSQDLVLGWILRNRKWRRQWRCASEVAASMAPCLSKIYSGGPVVNVHKEVSLGIVLPIMDRGIKPGLHQFQMSNTTLEPSILC